MNRFVVVGLVLALATLLCARASAQQLVHRFQAGGGILYAEGTHNNGADEVTVQAVGVEGRYMPSVSIARHFRLTADLSLGFSAPSSVKFNGDSIDGNAIVSVYGGGGVMWKQRSIFAAATVVYGVSKESVAADGSEYLTIGAFPMARLATGVVLTKLGRGHLELLLSGGIGFPGGSRSPQEWTLSQASLALGFAR
jgi:hypothetical protein